MEHKGGFRFVCFSQLTQSEALPVGYAVGEVLLCEVRVFVCLFISALFNSFADRELSVRPGSGKFGGFAIVFEPPRVCVCVCGMF